MYQLAADAQGRARAYDELRQKRGMTGVPTFTTLTDNSKKAYYKEFRKVMEAADVVLEVLDARDPLGCRCKQIEEMIQAKWPTKKIVFVLNKIGMPVIRVLCVMLFANSSNWVCLFICLFIAGW